MLLIVYAGLAVLGCGYVLVAGFLGHIVEGGDGGGHHVGGHGDSHYGVDGSGHGAVNAQAQAGPVFHFPFFSPLALATFVGALGAFGLIGRLGLGLGDWSSLIVAAVAGFGTSWLASRLAWQIMMGSVGSSEIRASELTGARGEVITPIPEGGLGEVAAMVGGQRYTAAARGSEGQAVPRGTAVTVVQMVGSTLVVRAETDRVQEA
jgi:membrane protein implicated in regulation of membrane protease activity